MAKIEIVNPTQARFYGDQNEIDAVRSFLTYTNTSTQFLLSKHMRNRWWKQKNLETWQARANELKQEVKSSLLFQDQQGYWIRPGSIPYLESVVHCDVVNNIEYPKPRPMPWYKPLPFKLYPYQTESVDNLITIKHGNVELCTGAGKSAIILAIAQKLGLKTIIVTPSQSIFSEILDKFEKHFGKSAVGALGDGKKRLGKLFTVCISKSLTNLKQGTKEYEEIASSQVLLGDESHTIPAKTLEEVCHGVLAHIPYRFFFSGTQTRGDGSEKLLHSIIGKTVKELSTKDAIVGKFICNHEYVVVPVLTCRPGYTSDDPLNMKRVHLLDNDNIAQFAAKLANASYQTKGEQTLILVEEIHQIAKVARYLQVPFTYAYGSGSTKEIQEYGLEKVDPTDAVEKFNKGEAKVLIGTSCISTGTNIFPTHNTVNWQGGASEIKTKQGAVGRSVRNLEGSGYEAYHVPKPKATIWDFDIIGVPETKRHLDARLGYYRDSGTLIRFLK